MGANEHIRGIVLHPYYCGQYLELLGKLPNLMFIQVGWNFEMDVPDSIYHKMFYV